jgi:signal transduction histidine kinase
VAEVSGTGEAGQSTERDAEHRAGLGLLSRFIGAVFLVLLGGLLLLDRALVRANRNQAALDAQSAALLAESFVDAHDVLLDRLLELADGRRGATDSTRLHAAASQLLVTMPSVRRAWLSTSDGRRLLEVSRPDSGGGTESSALVDSVDRARLPGRLAIGVVHEKEQAGHHGVVIAMVRSSPGTASDTLGRNRNARLSRAGPSHAGVLIEGDSLRARLSRTSPRSRIALSVLAGTDTVTRLDTTATRTQTKFDADETGVVRLPNGGTWSVLAAHALTTRWQRWGVWMLGVAGVLFLAIGLLREQRRALHVAARSVELERLYSDVKRANQAKSEFLANVSHELRTPLNAIVGFVELLRDGFYGDLTPRQVPPVDRIAASATHLRHLVDQVLDIAKIAAGRLEVHSETIVLRPFVLNVASELESLVSEKGLALSITVGASLPRVRTDPTHLRQILINLIGNAVKYTPAGSVSVRARLLGAPEEFGSRTPMPRAGMDDPSAAALLARAPRSGIWVALQVIDTGVGIAASDLARIFDEFEQVNAGPRGDSMQRGTGLGLAISRRLARLLGGDISVESVLGRGSTFTIWLPVSPADLARERPLTGEVQVVPTA